MATCAICGTPGHACGPTGTDAGGVVTITPVGARGQLRTYTVEPGQYPPMPAGGRIRLTDNYARAYGLLVDTPDPIPVEAEPDGEGFDDVPRTPPARVGDIIAWVHLHSLESLEDRARRALHAETTRGLGQVAPRKSLVTALEALLADPDDTDPDDEDPTP